MFFLAFFIAIIIGYALKGRLKNIDAARVKLIGFVFLAFFIEFIVLTLIKRGYMHIGILTYASDVIMYTLLLMFTYANKKNKWLLLLGIGSILNALVIFANGGLMPVNANIVDSFGYHGDVALQGLYKLADDNIKLYFLADIIPIKYPKPGIASIGDLTEILGMVIFIITEMKNKKIENNPTV
jgi:hypothetical protein